MGVRMRASVVDASAGVIDLTIEPRAGEGVGSASDATIAMLITCGQTASTCVDATVASAHEDDVSGLGAHAQSVWLQRTGSVGVAQREGGAEGGGDGGADGGEIPTAPICICHVSTVLPWSHRGGTHGCYSDAVEPLALLVGPGSVTRNGTLNITPTAFHNRRPQTARRGARCLPTQRSARSSSARSDADARASIMAVTISCLFSTAVFGAPLPALPPPKAAEEPATAI